MLNKDDIKIKYLIGTYRDNPEFPTLEDFQYLISNWYWNEGGKGFIHTYRGIPETGNIIFPDNVLQEKLNSNEEATKGLLELLLADKVIKVNKSTKFTCYYEINE
jgi:hypothetical protein